MEKNDTDTSVRAAQCSAATGIEPAACLARAATIHGRHDRGASPRHTAAVFPRRYESRLRPAGREDDRNDR